jgi:hypothetical protein
MNRTQAVRLTVRKEISGIAAGKLVVGRHLSEGRMKLATKTHQQKPHIRNGGYKKKIGKMAACKTVLAVRKPAAMTEACKNHLREHRWLKDRLAQKAASQWS